MYQWAEVDRIPSGFGTDWPIRRQAFVYRLEDRAFMGFPCPKKTTGIRGSGGLIPQPGLRKPAARTSGVTWSAYWAKFSWNIRASFRAVRSYAAGSSHVDLGSRTSGGTPGQLVGTRSPKIGSTFIPTPSSFPESAARSIALVWPISIRCPVPYGPPVHPVLTSQTFTLCAAIFSPRSLA